MQITFYRYTETFTYEHPFSESQLRLASAPKFREEFRIYEELISVPSIALEFIYNESLTDEFSIFLQQYKEEIDAVNIRKNDGELLFAGRIDADEAVEVDEENCTITFEFLHEISEALSDTDEEYLRTTAWFPTQEQIEAGNPNNIRIGEGSFEALFTQIVNDMLPGYTVSFPNNYYDLLPLYEYISDVLPGAYPGLVSAYYVANLQGKTLNEILKMMCIYGFCRINIKGDRTIEVVSYLTIENQEYDGNLARLGKKLYKEDQIAYSNDIILENLISIKIVYYDGWHYHEGFPGNVVVTYPHEWMVEFMENNKILGYKEAAFEGINSNLKCGDRFKYSNENHIIIQLERDSGMMEKDLQSVYIKTIEVISV
jgi:hypothetical protein